MRPHACPVGAVRILLAGIAATVALTLPTRVPAKERSTVESHLASAKTDPANVLVIVEVAGAKRNCAVFPVAGISKLEGRRVAVAPGTFVITNSPPPDKVSAKKLAQALVKKWQSRETKENYVYVGGYLLTFDIGELKESRDFEVEDVLEVARP